MKNFTLGLLTAFIIVGVGFFAYQVGLKKTSLTPSVSPSPTTSIPTLQPSSPPPVTITPSITTNPVSEENAIKQALIDKYNWNPDEMIITISKNDGTYASGGSRSKIAEAGGGYFFAAKVGGIWKIVADGNGTISCESLAPYPNYPNSMIPECWDEPSGKLIKR